MSWNDVWNRLKLFFIYFMIIIVIICFIILVAKVVFKYNPGSNADILQQPDAIMICKNPSFNETITFSYTFLSELDSIIALEYAEYNNCTFTHARFSTSKLKEEVLKNGTE